ncbi:hypothetical protein BC939DRAFT_434091 [Gamsiella multidivaricata]|uniref:uncharacterized protein n=1 Tax=Gamsiella multidivaricata TaxID=101098 RepID=UPI002220636F|nr:uncharacterized protein BC939DRAFT_434091 [Gamsiella multidivaricata]KAG0360105.1 hypothetical protein BGZ54_009698 [Gamsiella multidivaricata]KAI7832695.1 hypothetical protein BC939DRAFT_434091 [Gamsiella multidivaricata]
MSMWHSSVADPSLRLGPVCTYKTCRLQSPNNEHRMYRHLDIPYFHLHQGERIRLERIGKEGDEERPYECRCKEQFHYQRWLIDHIHHGCVELKTAEQQKSSEGIQSPAVVSPSSPLSAQSPSPSLSSPRSMTDSGGPPDSFGTQLLQKLDNLNQRQAPMGAITITSTTSTPSVTRESSQKSATACLDRWEGSTSDLNGRVDSLESQFSDMEKSLAQMMEKLNGVEKKHETFQKDTQRVRALSGMILEFTERMKNEVPNESK